MLRTLRNRLILSHILPMLVVIPLVAVLLAYLLESRFVLPQLAQNLRGDARLLTEISRSEYELWGNPVLFEIILSRLQLDPAVQVMLLNPEGRLLFSSDRADDRLVGRQLSVPGLEMAQSGEEAVLTNYAGLRSGNYRIDVLSPVIDSAGYLSGIVRVSYRVNSIYALFSELRLLIAGVLVFGLLLGVLVGSALAINIGKPVQQVTKAIYDLARGVRQDPLVEHGPEEIRNQVRAVNYLVARLQSLEQSRRQLLANLVHELGRPLGALRSAIQALAKGAGQDPHLLADLTSGMDQEASRLQRILDDLAHLHDQVLGSLELNLEALLLSDWLKGVLVPWEQAAQEKRLVWKEEIPPDLPTIQADPVRLAQVVGNLLSNAVKYTPSGKSVAVSAGATKTEVWIKVSDTGPGIHPDEQEKIFTPFYRGNQDRRIKQGMGLGLSIARDLAQAHGGRITLNSTPGLGSEFTVYIPSYQTADDYR